jgi:predicted amidohydrolase YtcJ
VVVERGGNDQGAARRPERWQPFHGEKLPDYYGDRLSRMFAHRSLLDADIPVAGSSDFPCKPLLALQPCITRTTARGNVLADDPRRIPSDQLSALPVTSTWLGGHQLWPRPI